MVITACITVYSLYCLCTNAFKLKRNGWDVTPAVTTLSEARANGHENALTIPLPTETVGFFVACAASAIRPLPLTSPFKRNGNIHDAIKIVPNIAFVVQNVEKMSFLLIYSCTLLFFITLLHRAQIKGRYIHYTFRENELRLQLPISTH